MNHQGSSNLIGLDLEPGNHTRYDDPGRGNGKSKTNEDVQKDRSLLVFRLNEHAFALDIENVVQIIPMLRLTPVPQINHIIEGIANIRGTIVPVISVRHHLGFPDLEPGLYTPIILTQVEERLVGWIVDEVTGVIHVSLEAVTMPAAILPEGVENSPVISGLVYQGDIPILVLNPHNILCSSQYRKFNRAFPAGVDTGGAQPDQVFLPPELYDDFKTLHVSSSDPVAPEIVRAAPSGEQVEQPPELPAKNRKRSTKKSGKANGRKGTIVSNPSVNSKPEQPLPQTPARGAKGRNIKAALASQFSVLADEVRETEERNNPGA